LLPAYRRQDAEIVRLPLSLAGRNRASISGQVIRLGGLAGPSDNWALGSAAFAKDLFRVTVSIAEIKEPGCGVGRTGRVLFESKEEANGSIASHLLDFFGLL
jgi:hypothetical protein